MTSDADCYDVFLCYKSEDAVTAEGLRVALTEAGLSVFRDEINGPAWAPLDTSIQAALYGSRTLIALITPRFPVSPHCRDELHRALCASYYLDDGDTSRVMAVVQGVGPEDVRPRQLTRFRLPRHGVLSAEFVATIVREVRRQDSRRFGDAPTPEEPDWYPRGLPGDAYFRGRHAELWELHEGLRAQEKTRDRGQPVAVVRGLGGQGKSALCLQYARLFERDHPGGVFVVRLEGSAGGEVDDQVVLVRFQEQMAAIARRLGLAHHEDLPAELDRRATKYLWIVDDVPATTSEPVFNRLIAPTRRGTTLVTTRGRSMSGRSFDRTSSQELNLPPLDPGSSEAVLTAYAGPAKGERKAVREIVQLLDHHALGLTIAAGLTTLPSFAGYVALLADLTESEADQLAVAAHLKRELPVGCAVPFARILLRSFDSLTDKAKDVAAAMSVLAPVVVPAPLLADVLRRVAGDNAEQELPDALQLATERSLVELGDQAGPTMHALIARALRVHLGTSGRRARLRASALAALTEAVESANAAGRHREILLHLPHVRAVAGVEPGGDRWAVGADERYLLNESGRAQVEAGDTGGALTTYELLHDFAVESRSVDPYTRYVVLNGLAVAYQLEGRLSRALRLSQEVVEGLRRDLGADDLLTLTAINNLALVHLACDEAETAHALLCSVYRKRRAALGRDDPETLVALSNLAIARGHLGDATADQNRNRRIAHRYWLGVCARWHLTAPPDNANALDALNGLALSYRALGYLEEALKLMQKVHSIRTDVLGATHPDTLGSLENILIIKEEMRERAG
ncbi:tetratricopeptide repeat protein [Amycolatopsis sp. A133]|uniref:tetratricopeptide repeat protein n=1 Tax=Amycolatopsis sp. A133 TaxID=3064472 RepID=UPI0027F1AB07|nr:tetratricopeptide repeat protein [Amycolatopsis sp. A133]MDQ7808412.1 tetratricopeptide repeat protein [Amycolatopsis sp. A133]